MRKLSIALMVLAGVLVSAASFAADAAAPAAEGPKYGMMVGDTAQPAQVKTLDGKDFSTEKPGKKSVFVIVNTVCGMCSRELADIEKNIDAFQKGNFYVVIVDITTERAGPKYAEIAKRATAILHDPDFKIGGAVGLYSTPATIVLDGDGKILYKQSGYKKETLKEVMEVL